MNNHFSNQSRVWIHITYTMLWTCEKLSILFRSKNEKSCEEHVESLSFFTFIIYLSRIMLSWTYKNYYNIVQSFYYTYQTKIFYVLTNKQNVSFPRNIFKCLHIYTRTKILSFLKMISFYIECKELSDMKAKKTGIEP